MRWDKQLIDFYGASKLARFLSKAGEEFSPNNDFETGKIAMEIDGEWRVQFIKSDGAKIVYGTAPMPVDPAQPSLYGGGYTTGNTIGIPKGAANPAAAWLLAKYLAFNTGAIEQFANGLGNIPTINSALSDPTLTSKPAVRHVPEDLRQPAHPDRSEHGDRSGQPGDAPELAEQVGGRLGAESGLASGLKSVDQQIDAQVANSDRGTGSVTVAEGAREERSYVGERARAGLPPLSPAPAAKRSGGVAAPAHGAALHEPVGVGFSVFFGYPLIDNAYLSFTHYDLLSNPALDRAGQLQVPVQRRSGGLAGGPQHALVPGDRGAAPGSVRLRGRDHGHARQGGRRDLPDDLLPADARPDGRLDPRLRVPLQPRDRPRQQLLSKIGITGPLWFQSPQWAKPSLTLLSLWGIGNAMVIFLAAILDVPKHLHEAAELDGAGALRRCGT